MKYENIVKARFLSRPNRFIANCEVDGETVIAHVRNTGRCRELLIPGTDAVLEISANKKRRTGYSLIAVRKGKLLINIDSLAPNKVMREALETGKIELPGFEPVTLVRPETRYGDSRFDFYLESGNKKAFLEVKGVTLEENGTALFPDAPTERGVKHIEGLIRAASEGYEAYIVFIVQMKGVTLFSPNTRMHPRFSEALKSAGDRGVHIRCYDCRVTENSMEFGSPVPVALA